ncbi:MAG: argininosuccinate lyase [Candidatus Cloacimonadota bacterium]|nr:MAG: argininosuccinate lyase [Candidatus Cloacimonadota bacterium]
MGKKLWQTKSGLHPLVEAYTTSDILADQLLLPYDIQASSAHASMLCKIGVIDSDEESELQKALDEILSLYNSDKFILTKDQEDCHTAIEQYITEHYGQVGKKIHTGRSRNDQALVMMRLYMKDQVQEVSVKLKDLFDVFEVVSKKYMDVAMPGYTHMQRAMPTSVGIFFDSYFCAFKDISLLMSGLKEFIDQNPLGSAAGFGINHLELDRQETTDLLNMNRVQTNPLYCALSRGYFENTILSTLSQIMILTSRFSVDMMLFTTQEFSYFSLSDEYVTGSSIMPQKKNYDLFEVMRGNSKLFFGYESQIRDIILGLGSGYHRDLGLTKVPFVRALDLLQTTLDLLIEVVPNLNVNKENLKKSMTKELFVTDEVYKKVAKGEAFRDAYLEVKESFFRG